MSDPKPYAGGEYAAAPGAQNKDKPILKEDQLPSYTYKKGDKYYYDYDESPESKKLVAELKGFKKWNNNKGSYPVVLIGHGVLADDGVSFLPNSKFNLTSIEIYSTKLNQIQEYSYFTDMFDKFAEGGNIGLYACVCGGSLYDGTKHGKSTVLFSDNFGETNNPTFLKFLKDNHLI